jgi:hypothetical protein
MMDKTAIGISDALRQCLEAIAEDVILGGGTFEGQKKYLRRYCEVESIDYDNLEKALLSLFDSASSYKESGAKSSEQSIRISAQDCYLSEETIQKLISSLKDFRDKEDAKRLADNRELLLNDKWFSSFPVIRDEMLTVADREDFFDTYFSGYQAVLKKLHTTIKKLRDGLSDEIIQQSSNYQAFSLSANYYLDKAPALHCSEVKSAQEEGKKLMKRMGELRNQVLSEREAKKKKEKEIKRLQRRRKKGRALAGLGIVLILITWWIFTRDFSLWKTILVEVWFLIMFGGGGVLLIISNKDD